MIKCDDGTYDFIKATVRDDGILLQYRATDLPISGSDFIDDESANQWTDREIRDMAASYLNVTSGKKEIEVLFE